MTESKRTQYVSLYVDGKRIDSWQPVPGEVHRVQLPKGFQLGLLLDPATEEKYRELFTRHKTMLGIEELVKIVLLDMSQAPPTELSTTWGGANSQQGFGPRGGANGVPQLVDQITLDFHKPVCVTPESLSARSQ
jgi:hypothetical protein